MSRRMCFALLVLVLPLMASCGSENSPEKVLIPGARYTAPGGLSFSYPQDWIVMADEEGPLFVATSEHAASGGRLGKGEAVVVIIGPDLTAELGADLSPLPMLKAVAEEIGGENTAIGEITGTMLNGRQAARASLKDDRGEGIGLAVDLGNRQIVVVLIGAAPGELRKVEAIGMAIAGSISD